METDNKTYNGYKNWATWNVVLWFNNDMLLYYLSKNIKSAHEVKVIFNTEFELFKDFKDNEEEINNIDWNEVYEALKDN